MNADVHYEKPLLLLFSEFGPSSFHAILADNDDIILRQNREITTKKHISSSEDISSWNVQYEGIELDISLNSDYDNIHDYKQIFCNVDVEKLTSALVISLGSHVKNGRRNPAIMASFFRFAQQLVKSLQPEAVAWNITKIISDSSYFAETIDHYENGGAFPILSTIDFIHKDDDRICSRGLTYFSEQEVCYLKKDLDIADIMKRIMRIVHDIAVNGAYANDMQITGLDVDEKILITVNNPNLAEACSIF